MSDRGYIYLVTNKVNLKRYVGQTKFSIEKRWTEHKNDVKWGSELALHRAMRKYGVENFTITEVVRCEILLLNDLEKHYIKFFGTLAHEGHGYNQTEGGDGIVGAYRSPEWRAKISKARIGMKNSAESRELMKGNKNGVGNKANTGRTLPEETCRKMSLSRKGKKLTPEHCAAMKADWHEKRGKV
jgi:group I intron endonuclease